MEFTWLSRWQPQLRAVLRIMVALLFLQHVTIKFFGFPPGGMPGPQPVGSLLWFAAVVELVCSAAILAGLWTRLFAFIASGEMAIGYFIIHAPQSFYPAVNQGEAAVLYCFIFLYLAAAGPGSWSLDAALFRARLGDVERR